MRFGLAEVRVNLILEVPSMTMSREERVRDQPIARGAEDWAREFARAEALERALARAERSAADWQAIALDNGEKLELANAELERLNRRAA